MGGLLGHTGHLRQRLNDVVLPKSKGLPSRLPRLGVDLQKSLLEGVQLALPIQKTLQGSNFHVVAIVAAMLVKYFGKDPQDRVAILPHGRLGVDIEQNDFGRRFADAPHHGIAIGIIGEFILEIIDGFFAVHFFIGKQIRQDLQKM